MARPGPEPGADESAISAKAPDSAHFDPARPAGRPLAVATDGDGGLSEVTTALPHRANVGISGSGP